MEKYIILTMQKIQWLTKHIVDVDSIAACNEDGELLIFDSFEDAAAYQEDNSIDGRLVELPIY